MTCIVRLYDWLPDVLDNIPNHILCIEISIAYTAPHIL